MHIFHKWKQIHYAEIEDHQGWLCHDKCSTCGEDRLASRLKFFATIDDAIELGILIGIYKGFHPQFKFDD